MYADGTVGLMRNLRIGERVASIDVDGRQVYSDVFAFGHQDPHSTDSFVRLTITGDVTLELSAGHYIPTGAQQTLLIILSRSINCHACNCCRHGICTHRPISGIWSSSVFQLLSI